MCYPYNTRSMGNRFIGLTLFLALAGCQSGQPVPAERPRDQAPVAAGKSDSDPIIVAFGNSLTAGQGVLGERNYPSQLQALLDQDGYAYRVVNAGISADTTAQGLSRLPSVIDQQPRLVILELGANDGLRGIPIPTIRGNIEEMIERLKIAKIRVVLAGMRIPPNYGAQYAEQFHRIYLELGKKHSLTVIPFLLEGVAGHPDLNLQDGIHPTEEGYRIVTRTVFDAIKRELRIRN